MTACSNCLLISSRHARTRAYITLAFHVLSSTLLLHIHAVIHPSITAKGCPFGFAYLDMGINTAQRLLLIASCLAVLALAAGDDDQARISGGFARANGTRFTVAGRPFYSNGFNAYWLMYMGSNPADRSKVLDTLDQASRLGARLVRTMAFNDGGSNRPLQITAGVYNEDTFMVCLGLTLKG